MSFSVMISMLVGRKFTKQGWRKGTYISYGYLDSDTLQKYPCIILSRQGYPNKKFLINKNDLKGEDWYEVKEC